MIVSNVYLVTCYRCNKQELAKCTNIATIKTKLPQWFIETGLQLCPSCAAVFQQMKNRHQTEISEFLGKFEEVE